MRTILIFSILSVLCIASKCAAIEIPLEGDREKVAYVNLHKIFETYPETEKARAELTALITSKRGEITQKKEEIAHLKGEIESIKRELTIAKSTSSLSASTIPFSISGSTYSIQTSTFSLKMTLESLLKEKETQLTKAQATYPAFLTLSEEEIHNDEEGKTMALLALIYKAIETLSRQEKYTIVLDKENILYGVDMVDLTPKILKLLEQRK